jgi:hypothetical protein
LLARSLSSTDIYRMADLGITRITPHGQRSVARRAGIWLAGAIACPLMVVFIASFFFDGIVRSRIEASMNRSLKGYHVTLAHAHLQLLTLRLTLDGLTIAQQAHPIPPIGDLPLVRFRIEWKELLSGRVVANVGLWNPKIHIDQAQFISEKKDKTPLRKKGWQDALENVYPFKINRFVIHEGDIVYIDSSNSKPLRLTHLNFIADNIRNIHEPNNVYPSGLSASMVVFDHGRMNLDGRANYLMEPFSGIKTRFTVSNVPLSAVTSAIQHINIMIRGGILSSNGWLEYSPKVTNVDVDKVTIDTIDVQYIHKPGTENDEAKRVDTAGKAIEKQNNRPAVNIKIRELEIKRSRFAFDDDTADPHFTLYLTDTDLSLTNLSNHQQQGPAIVSLKGKFMGSGTTNVKGRFLASREGPAFNVNVAIQNTEMTALNPLLRAYGRFDVAQGLFTVYSQLDVKDGDMTGYVKPMFSNLRVYDYEKDKNKGAIDQAKELIVGAAAHVFKNSQTQKVATEVSITGKLKKPNVSTWQALVVVVENAFVNAILPGFDREVHRSASANATR